MSEPAPTAAAGPRYAALWLRDFRLQALRRNDPALAGKPVVLVDAEGRDAVVAEAAAEAGGAEPGTPIALATARCPGLVARMRDVGAEVEAQRILIAASFTLSPRVEATGGGLCTVDLQGADPAETAAAMQARVAELARAGLALRIGAAATPLLAAYAARCAEPVLAIGDAAAFLAPLPLGLAEPPPACAEILARWGIRTLGGLTALAKAGIGQRLGTQGIALWERAAGQTVRVLRLVEPVRTFAAEWTYEPPVESMEPLLFRLRRHAERLALELRAAGFVADRLALTLFLENEAEHRREFRLPEPCGDPDPWMRVLQAHLETVRTPARVSGARLVAAPARPPQRQDGLFDTGLVDPHAFWENLARLAAMVGDDRVGTPVPADTHRPESFTLQRPAETIAAPADPPVHPERGPLLRRFRPPWPVRVALASRRPAELSEGRLNGTVRSARGPWRASGDWWKPGAWAAETWHVELAGGGIYQLARTTGGWRVEGALD